MMCSFSDVKSSETHTQRAGTSHVSDDDTYSYLQTVWSIPYALNNNKTRKVPKTPRGKSKGHSKVFVIFASKKGHTKILYMHLETNDEECVQYSKVNETQTTPTQTLFLPLTIPISKNQTSNQPSWSLRLFRFPIPRRAETTKAFAVQYPIGVSTLA